MTCGNIAPCYICGGRAELNKRTLSSADVREVICTVCGCRTHPVPVDRPIVDQDGIHEDTRYTAPEAEHKAICAWNTGTWQSLIY